MSTTNPKITVLPDIDITTTTTTTPLTPLPPWKRPSADQSTPEIFTRIGAFLPQLRAANAQLESEIAQGRIGERRIEDVGEDEEQYIEMNLGLGVLEEKKEKRAAKARKRRRGMGVGAQVEFEEEEERDEEEGEEEEGEDSDSEDGSEDIAEEEEEESDSSISSSSSTSNTHSSAQYPQQQGKQRGESTRIDALLDVLGAEYTESPQLLGRKRKRGHEKRVLAQRDILAALLNIDTPPSGCGSGGGGAKGRPVIEVVEVNGKE